MCAALLWRRRVLSLNSIPTLQVKRALTTFQEGDHVLLKPAKEPSHQGYLSKPLNIEDSFFTTHGQLKYADVIGTSPQDVVRTKKGIGFRVHEASLADYVVLTKRIVTPIYPAHANVIANLLELHPAQASASRKLEILEAGTGHGGLTLYLARAMHGTNPPCPDLPIAPAATPSTGSTGVSDEKSQQADETAFSEWKAKRNGIVHTLDISQKHSDHARLVVRNFRRGLYYGNVDFHVGDLTAFFQKRTESSSGSQALLDHVILDMPSTDEQIPVVTPHLRPDGKLLVFNPSITQIVECVRTIAEKKLSLELERVVELPQGVAGGREWDVRVAAIRNAVRQASESSEPSSWFRWLRNFFSGPASTVETSAVPMAFICRPKIVSQMAVGGFVAVWRRTSDST